MEQIEKETRELIFNVPWGYVTAKAWGSPDNKPILAVHGTLDNAGSFTNLCKLLPNKYYIVTIDLPGHGFSTHFPPGMSLDFFNFVLVIKYVFDQLKWRTCLYIGHSFGGQLGMVFSILFPNILEKIISVDAFLPKVISNEELLDRLKMVSQTTLSYNSNKNSKMHFYTKDEVLNALKTRRQFPLNDSAAHALFERAVTQVDNDLYKLNRDIRMKIYVFPTLNCSQYMQLIKHMKTPALIIIATNSWFDVTNENRKEFELFKKEMPSIYTIEIVDGNHDVHNNNPERILSLIVKYLENNNTGVKSKL